MRFPTAGLLIVFIVSHPAFSAEAANAVPVAAIDRNWTQPCLESDETWSTANQSYTGGNATAVYAMYDAAGCRTKMMETSSTGTYTTGIVGSNNSIDFVISKIFFTIYDSDIVDYFNSVSYCGLRTWRAGVKLYVTGKTCEGEIMGGIFMMSGWLKEPSSLQVWLTIPIMAELRLCDRSQLTGVHR